MCFLDKKIAPMDNTQKDDQVQKDLEQKLKLQGANGEFGMIASKFFRENNISTAEALYILSGYMHSLSFRALQKENE